MEYCCPSGLYMTHIPPITCFALVFSPTSPQSHETYCSWFGAICAPTESPGNPVFPANCSAESRAKTCCTANVHPVSAGCVCREQKLMVYTTRKLQSIIISPDKQAGLRHKKRSSRRVVQVLELTHALILKS